MLENDNILTGVSICNLLKQRKFNELYYSPKRDENRIPFGGNDLSIIQYVNLSPTCPELVESFAFDYNVSLIGLITKILNTPKLDTAYINTFNSRALLASNLSKYTSEFSKYLTNSVLQDSHENPIFELICSILPFLSTKRINNFLQALPITSVVGRHNLYEWVKFVGRIGAISPKSLLILTDLRNVFLSKISLALSPDELIDVLTDVLYNLETQMVQCQHLCNLLLSNLMVIYDLEDQLDLLNRSKTDSIKEHPMYKTIVVLSRFLVSFDALFESLDMSFVLHQVIVIYSLRNLSSEDMWLFLKKLFNLSKTSNAPKGAQWIVLSHLFYYILSAYPVPPVTIFDDEFISILSKYSLSHYILAPYYAIRLATYRAIKAFLKLPINLTSMPDIKTLINSRFLEPNLTEVKQSQEEEFLTNFNAREKATFGDINKVYQLLFNDVPTNLRFYTELFETLEMYAVKGLMNQVDFVRITDVDSHQSLHFARARCLFICHMAEVGFSVSLDTLVVTLHDQFFRCDLAIGQSLVKIVEDYWIQDINNEFYPYILPYLLYATGLIDLGSASNLVSLVYPVYCNNLNQIGKVRYLSDLYYLVALRPLESIAGIQFLSVNSNQVVGGLTCIECYFKANSMEFDMKSLNLTYFQLVMIRLLWHIFSLFCSSFDPKRPNYEVNYLPVRCHNCNNSSNLLALGKRFNLDIVERRAFNIPILLSLLRLDVDMYGDYSTVWASICKGLTVPRPRINYALPTSPFLHLQAATVAQPIVDPKDKSIHSTIVPKEHIKIFAKLSNLDLNSLEELPDLESFLDYAIEEYTCDRSSDRDRVFAKAILLSTLKHLSLNDYINVWEDSTGWYLLLPNLKLVADINSNWLSLDTERLDLTLQNLNLQYEEKVSLPVYDLSVLVPWYVGRLYWARVLSKQNEYKEDLDSIAAILNLSPLTSNDWFYDFAVRPLKLLIVSLTDTNLSSMALNGILVYYELLTAQISMGKVVFGGQSQLLSLLDYLFRLIKNNDKINSFYTIFVCESISHILQPKDTLFPTLTTLCISKKLPNTQIFTTFYQLWYPSKISALRQSRLFFLRVFVYSLNARDRDVILKIASKLHILPLLHSYHLTYDNMDEDLHNYIELILSVA